MNNYRNRINTGTPMFISPKNGKMKFEKLKQDAIAENKERAKTITLTPRSTSLTNLKQAQKVNSHVDNNAEKITNGDLTRQASFSTTGTTSSVFMPLQNVTLPDRAAANDNVGVTFKITPELPQTKPPTLEESLVQSNVTTMVLPVTATDDENLPSPIRNSDPDSEWYSVVLVPFKIPPPPPPIAKGASLGAKRQEKGLSHIDVGLPPDGDTPETCFTQSDVETDLSNTSPIKNQATPELFEGLHAVKRVSSYEADNFKLPPAAREVSLPPPISTTAPNTPPSDTNVSPPPLQESSARRKLSDDSIVDYLDEEDYEEAMEFGTAKRITTKKVLDSSELIPDLPVYTLLQFKLGDGSFKPCIGVFEESQIVCMTPSSSSKSIFAHVKTMNKFRIAVQNLAESENFLNEQAFQKLRSKYALVPEWYAPISKILSIRRCTERDEYDGIKAKNLHRTLKVKTENGQVFYLKAPSEETIIVWLQLFSDIKFQSIKGVARKQSLNEYHKTPKNNQKVLPRKMSEPTFEEVIDKSELHNRIELLRKQAKKDNRNRFHEFYKFAENYPLLPPRSSSTIQSSEYDGIEFHAPVNPNNFVDIPPSPSCTAGGTFYPMEISRKNVIANTEFGSTVYLYPPSPDMAKDHKLCVLHLFTPYESLEINNQ